MAWTVQGNIKGAKGDKGDTGDAGTPGTTTWAGITDKPSTFAPTTHTHSDADISNATTVGKAVLEAANAGAARTAIGAGTSSLSVGTTEGTACEGNDSRLSDARTPTAAGQVADLSIVAFGKDTVRAASSYGDFPFGVHLCRAITFTEVTFRVATADASGNLVVELRKNGAQVAGTPTTIAAANQVAGGTSTGTWAFAAGDIITVYITAVGTTPGKGLIADIKGLTT